MAEPEKTPDIADFTQSKKVAPETQAAFQKFLGDANPLGVKSEGGKVEPIADPQKHPEVAEEQIEAAIEQVNQAPEKTYQERLKEHKISLKEAREIVDTIMTKGVYERTYPLTSKTEVTFRSRDLSDQERTQNTLEEQQPQFMGTVNMIMAKQNLAASLVALGTHTFSEDEFEKALQFVGKLPHVLFNVLVAKLSLFDELVLTVMDEGAIENF